MPKPENLTPTPEPIIKPPVDHIFSFWPRLLALIIDCTIIWILGTVFGLIFGIFLGQLGYAGSLVGLIIVLLYFGLFNSRIGHGQTPGKKLCRIKVVRKKDGAYLSVFRSLVRALILALPFFIGETDYSIQILLATLDLKPLIWSMTLMLILGGAIGYLFLFNRRTRQSLHDLCSGSIVIKEKITEIGTLKRTGYLHYMILIFIVIISYPFSAIITTISYSPFQQFPIRDLHKALHKINNVYGVNLFPSATSTIIVYLKNPPLSYENTILKVARTALKHDFINYNQKMEIEVRSGYDIGIAKNYHRRKLTFSKNEWQEQIDSVSTLIKGPKKFQYFPGNVRASSFLKSDWNKFEENYLPQYLFDDRPSTAWVEDSIGKNRSGVGEYVVLSGLPIKKVKSLTLKIRNGYQKSDSLYLANSRPKELELFSESSSNSSDLKRLKPLSYIKLVDKMGWQEFTIPVHQDLRSLIFKIKSIYPGIKYQDTCISDLQIFVNTDAEYDLTRALTNKTAIDRFIVERVNKAKNMSKLATNGLIKLTYFKLSAEAVKQFPIPQQKPPILQNSNHLLEEHLKFTYRYQDYNRNQFDTSLTDRELHESLFNSLHQLNDYSQAIHFLPWIADLLIDSIEVNPTPVDERYIDEVLNDYDTPFDNAVGKSLRLKFLEYHDNKNKILDVKQINLENNGSPKVKFQFMVGAEKWQGLSSKFYITPCCCGGGPRWVYEFLIYDSGGFLRWKYQYDGVRKRMSSFFIWNEHLPQLEKVIVLKDVDFQEGFGAFPGLMEIWE